MASCPSQFGGKVKAAIRAKKAIHEELKKGTSNLYESEVMKCRKSISIVKDTEGKSMAGRAKDNKEVL